MSETPQQVSCVRCGAVMEAGYTTATGLVGSNPLTRDPKLIFVVPGQATSRNPMKAFQQGMAGERTDAAYLLHGHRCPNCGVVELFATERTPWTP